MTAPKKVGRYDLLYEIDSGGMGTVFRGRDEDLDRAVAVKMLSQELFASLDHQLRFIQEAKIIARLDHPGIMKIYAIEYFEGNAFLIMEYLEGTPLGELIENKSKFSVAEAIPIFEQLAGALSHAHSKGVVHLDIKPSNVIVQSDGIVKLMDFGISFDAQSDLNLPNSSQQFMGTPKYMSPEQFSNLKVDLRSDIYSFGILAYEMLTGSPPFEGNNRDEYIEMHTKETPTPIEKLVPGCPKQLRKFINQSLEKKPDFRPQTLEGLTFSHKTNTTITFSIFPPVASPKGDVSPWVKWAGPIILSIIVAILGWIFLPQKSSHQDPKTFQRESLVEKNIHTSVELPEETPEEEELPLQKPKPKKKRIVKTRPPVTTSVVRPDFTVEEKEEKTKVDQPEKKKEEYQTFGFFIFKKKAGKTHFSDLLMALSHTNKSFSKRQNAIKGLLMVEKKKLQDLLPFIRSNDPIVVKHVAYVLGIRNYKSAILEIRRRIAHTQDEALLAELFRSLGYFHTKAAKRLLNQAFLEQSSLGVFRAILSGLHGQADKAVIDKAMMLQSLIQDENIRAEILAFLASHGYFHKGIRFARKYISKGNDNLKIQCLKIFQYSRDPGDLEFIDSLKREFYTTVPLMNAYVRARCLMMTHRLRGLKKYKEMQELCKKNRGVLAWLALYVSLDSNEDSYNWLGRFLRRHELSDYVDYIRAKSIWEDDSVFH